MFLFINTTYRILIGCINLYFILFLVFCNNLFIIKQDTIKKLNQNSKNSKNSKSSKSKNSKVKKEKEMEMEKELDETISTFMAGVPPLA